MQTQTGGWAANPARKDTLKIYHFYSPGKARSACGRAKPPKEAATANQHPPGQGCAYCEIALSKAAK